MAEMLADKVLPASLPAAVTVLQVPDRARAAASLALGSRAGWAALAFVGYVAVCSALRFRREKATRRRYGYTGRESLARMTNDQAQEIVEMLTTCEFPEMSTLGLQLALFKTYVFETSSDLLLATRQLSDPRFASKRYEDTTVIFGQFMLNPPTSSQHAKAVARMNYLHRPYEKAGKIVMEDMLYTLAVAMSEPIRVFSLFEWRKPNELEVAAYATFWRSLGEAMNMDFKGHLGKDQWRDGIEFFEALDGWAKKHERTHTVRTRKGRELADAVVGLFLWWVPPFACGFIQQMLVALMGDRLRDAFMYEEPGIFAHALVYSVLSLRCLFLRYLCLPRFRPVRYFSDPDPRTGRIHHYTYLKTPHWNPRTAWNTWGPAAWFIWATGGEKPGKEFGSDGFLMTDVGPSARSGAGAPEMREDEERLMRPSRAGCPFSRPR